MTVAEQVASRFNLSPPQAQEVIYRLKLSSVDELSSRYIGDFKNYQSVLDLEHDIYEVYCVNIPYTIVCGLIIADEPIRAIL